MHDVAARQIENRDNALARLDVGYSRLQAKDFIAIIFAAHHERHGIGQTDVHFEYNNLSPKGGRNEGHDQ